MEKRQNGGRKRQIVQEFVKNLDDDTERKVCYLYMRNHTDKEVRRQLGINRPQLAAIKLKLAIGLKDAGIMVS